MSHKLVSAQMKFIFIIPVYNEEGRIEALVKELLPFVLSRPGSVILFADNASSDGSVPRIEEFVNLNPDQIKLLKSPRKGQGVAFAMAMAEIALWGVDPQTWITLTAADLPFLFSDVLAIEAGGADFDLVIGCKSHPASQVDRSPVRNLMSVIFRLIRFLFLGMRSYDPQGSLSFRAQYLELRKGCSAANYFFATELVYEFESRSLQILEVPVFLRLETRPSKVNVLQDSLRILRQTWEFSKRRGRIRSAKRTQLYSADPHGPDWK